MHRGQVEFVVLEDVVKYICQPRVQSRAASFVKLSWKASWSSSSAIIMGKVSVRGLFEVCLPV